MEPITYSQVQELVMRLPTTRLPLAYRLLADLADQEDDGLSPQLRLMRLPLDERRRVMAQQAEQMTAHYEQTASERQVWQGGDFLKG